MDTFASAVTKHAEPAPNRTIFENLGRVPDFNPPADGYKRFVFPDGKGVYDGHWQGYKRHGQGSFSFANGDVYDGELSRWP